MQASAAASVPCGSNCIPPGQWVAGPAPDHWSWAPSRPQASVAGRWLLFLGDSRGRMAYSAAVARASPGKPPPGWPMHRAEKGDPCEPHLRNASRKDSWGYYNSGCQERWKGGCRDDHSGRNVRKVCALDHFSPQTRLTYLWHSLNTRQHLASLLSRVERLMVDAGGSPDAVLISTGLWDMQFSQPWHTCPRMVKALSQLRQLMPTTHIALLGFEKCPECPKNSDLECLHWGRQSRLGSLMYKGHDCGINITASLNATYLDLTTLTRTLPRIRSSPCGAVHLFGAGSEAIVSDFYASANSGQAASFGRPPSPRALTPPNFTALEQYWLPGWYRHAP